MPCCKYAAVTFTEGLLWGGCRDSWVYNLERKKTSVLNLLVIQFDTRDKLRLLICDFFGEETVSARPESLFSSTWSSTGRVEKESSSKMSKDIDRISRVRRYRLDANLERLLKCNVNENYKNSLLIDRLSYFQWCIHRLLDDAGDLKDLLLQCARYKHVTRG